MHRFVKAAAISMLIVAASACTTIGTKFDISKVDQLRPGVSTIADAKLLLGAPVSLSDMGNRGELLQWQYIRGTMVGGSGSHAAILFDRDGKMVRVVERTQI